MITTLSAIILLGALQVPATPTVASSQAEVDVRKSVQAFYDAYNAHEFDMPASDPRNLAYVRRRDGTSSLPVPPPDPAGGRCIARVPDKKQP